MPNTASTITSTLGSDSAWANATARAPAASASCRADCDSAVFGIPARCTTVTSRPSRCASAATTQPSPPLLPSPQATSSRRASGQRARNRRQAAAPARCISTYPSPPTAAIARASIARTWALVYSCEGGLRMAVVDPCVRKSRTLCATVPSGLPLGTDRCGHARGALLHAGLACRSAPCARPYPPDCSSAPIVAVARANMPGSRVGAHPVRDRATRTAPRHRSLRSRAWRAPTNVGVACTRAAHSCNAAVACRSVPRARPCHPDCASAPIVAVARANMPGSRVGAHPLRDRTIRTAPRHRSLRSRARRAPAIEVAGWRIGGCAAFPILGA